MPTLKLNGLTRLWNPSTSFEDRMMTFLEDYGTLESHTYGSNGRSRKIWRVDLSIDTNGSAMKVVPVHVIDFDLPDGCRFCKAIKEWKNRPVCLKGYIITIPWNFGSVMKMSAWLAKQSTYHVIWGEAPYQSIHATMFGFVHLNGFGHLISVTSCTLTGNLILKIWDSLCSALSVRAISVKDDAEIVTMSGSVKLWILRAVANRGEGWFFKKGYTKIVESIDGESLQQFEAAKQLLKSVNLSEVYDFTRVNNPSVFHRGERIVDPLLESLPSSHRGLPTLNAVFDILLKCRYDCIDRVDHSMSRTIDSFGKGHTDIVKVVGNVFSSLMETGEYSISKSSLRAQTLNRLGLEIMSREVKPKSLNREGPILMDQVLRRRRVDSVISNMKNVVIDFGAGFCFIK